MYDTSAKLTFGVGGKKYMGYKKLQGAPKTYKRRKKPIRKTKKSGDLFFVVFGKKLHFCSTTPCQKFWLRPWFYSHLLNRIMLRKVEAMIGLELCEQNCAERARYQGINYTPP